VTAVSNSMRLSGNTILITGGTSGIGLELATRFAAMDNTVIITGRNQAKLDDVSTKLPGVHAIQSDVSDPTAITALYDYVTGRFPHLNVLINNAGIMRKINLHGFRSDLQELTREIEINLDGPIRTTVQFLPQLKAQKAAAVVNVSSGLAFVPLAISPIYCATKAAIHSFTQSLRVQLKRTNITVFELAPPITETPLFQGDMSQSDVGVKPMKVKVLVQHALDGMKRDCLEIRPGLANMLKIMSCVAPNLMVHQLGKPVDRMLARKE
jgi:uncharacterized oxidoreductase